MVGLSLRARCVVGVLLCILGTVVRYKIISVDLLRDLVKFFFSDFKKKTLLTRFWQIIELAGRKKREDDEDDTEEEDEEKAQQRRRRSERKLISFGNR